MFIDAKQTEEKRTLEVMSCKEFEEMDLPVEKVEELSSMKYVRGVIYNGVKYVAETDMPIKPLQSGSYRLSDADKEFLASKAIGEIIPINDYITALNKILNNGEPSKSGLVKKTT